MTDHNEFSLPKLVLSSFASCHPERSEGSAWSNAEVLHYAQDDKVCSVLVDKIHLLMQANISWGQVITANIIQQLTRVGASHGSFSRKGHYPLCQPVSSDV